MNEFISYVTLSDRYNWFECIGMKDDKQIQMHNLVVPFTVSTTSCLQHFFDNTTIAFINWDQKGAS